MTPESNSLADPLYPHWFVNLTPVKARALNCAQSTPGHDMSIILDSPQVAISLGCVSFSVSAFARTDSMTASPVESLSHRYSRTLVSQKQRPSLTLLIQPISTTQSTRSQKMLGAFPRAYIHLRTLTFAPFVKPSQASLPRSRPAAPNIA